MATTYYNLPTITPSTIANGPDAINGLANATDAALHTVEAMIPESADITEISEKADAASVNAQAALNSASAANQTASQANQTAGAAVTTANAAQSAAATNAGNISVLQSRADALEALFNFNRNYQNVSITRSGIFNASTNTYLGTGASGAAYALNSSAINAAVNSTGTYGKVYGTFRASRSGTLAANETPVVGFPLSAIGVATPSETFTVAAAGLVFYKDTMSNIAYTNMIFCADGYCYLEGAGSVANDSVAVVLPPCIYQFTDFGD